MTQRYVSITFSSALLSEFFQVQDVMKGELKELMCQMLDLPYSKVYRIPCKLEWAHSSAFNNVADENH